MCAENCCRRLMLDIISKDPIHPRTCIGVEWRYPWCPNLFTPRSLGIWSRGVVGLIGGVLIGTPLRAGFTPVGLTVIINNILHNAIIRVDTACTYQRHTCTIDSPHTPTPLLRPPKKSAPTLPLQLATFSHELHQFNGKRRLKVVDENWLTKAI